LRRVSSFSRAWLTLLLATWLLAGLPINTANVDAQDGGSPFPLTIVDASGNEVAIESVDAIASGSGDVTEIIAALGFADRLVGVDISSTYPEGLMDALPSIGFARRLAVEPIAAVNPSIFFCTETCGPATVFDQLRELNIPVVIIPDNERSGINLPLEKVTMIAAALGVPERGEALNARISRELEWVKTASANIGEPPAVMMLYLRGRNLQLAAGRGTPSQFMIEAAGGVDVGTAAGVVGYQPLSSEILLNAFPEYILLMQGGIDGIGGVDKVLEIQGVADTPAGQEGNLLIYDDQFLLGMSTRTGQAVMDIAHRIHPEMTWEMTVSYPYTVTDVTGTSVTVDGAGPVMAANEGLLELAQQLGFHALSLEARADDGLILAAQSDDWASLRAAGWAVIVVSDNADIAEVAAVLNAPGRGEALIARRAKEG
jgi:iron complex transport system substrate-binding protein